MLLRVAQKIDEMLLLAAEVAKTMRLASMERNIDDSASHSDSRGLCVNGSTIRGKSVRCL